MSDRKRDQYHVGHHEPGQSCHTEPADLCHYSALLRPTGTRRDVVIRSCVRIWIWI
ncbi:hypothetical protein [Flindersiella endophytica]